MTGQGAGGGPVGLSTQFAAPIDLKVGGAGAGVEVDSVVTQVDAALQDGRFLFRARFRYSAKAEFGPLGATLDGAGVWIGRWSDGNGGLLPPQGIGLTLDAGPVSGGGFLDIISADEFAGALQVKILGIGAFAYGLYKALPSGDPSVVALIGIRLPLPGVQLGFGFAVSGFGGLVGINRRADTDLLRERLADGSAGDVLFNDDPMKNAPKLLGDMQQFFPDEQGIFLIGPTLQLNWLAILTLDVGLFIELPGPRKIFLAGSARLVIGSEDFALVYLRLDFVGGVDLTKSLVFFDAVLVNSSVLGIFRITGGMSAADRVRGQRLLPVQRRRVPPVVPSGRDGAAEGAAGRGLDVDRDRLAQAGDVSRDHLQHVPAGIAGRGRDRDRADLGARLVRLRRLDPVPPVLLRRSRRCRFDVEVEGVSLCSVQVEGQLSGPGPLVLEARASVRLLFIKVSGHVTIELSSNPPEPVVAVPNLPEALRGELTNPDNLRMEGQDPSVVLGPSATGGAKALPTGRRAGVGAAAVPAEPRHPEARGRRSGRLAHPGRDEHAAGEAPGRLVRGRDLPGPRRRRGAQRQHLLPAAVRAADRGRGDDPGRPDRRRRSSSG